MNSRIGILGTTKLFELEEDTQLTDFISSNYERLVREAIKFVDRDMCENLVHDMYISLRNREKNGNGFRFMVGKRGDVLTVNQCIFGYMKAASKNVKYQKVTETADSNGRAKEIPCSVNGGEDYDTLTICQKTYASMASIDDLEMTEEQYDLVENMSYLVSYEFSNPFKYSVMSVLSKVMKLLHDNAVTNDILEAFKSMNAFENANDEFKEAFRSVVTAGIADNRAYKNAFNTVVKEYGDMIECF